MSNSESNCPKYETVIVAPNQIVANGPEQQPQGGVGTLPTLETCAQSVAQDTQNKYRKCFPAPTHSQYRYIVVILNIRLHQSVLPKIPW